MQGQRMSVSVVIIARDEAEDILDCLASADWADERLVVDTGSTDGTPETARAAGARVLSSEWSGYAQTKNRAFQHARGEWVLSLDADERVSDELAREIQQVVRKEGACDAYDMPRRFHFMGRWLRHGGCYPDYQLRLFRRGRARYDDVRIHERLAVEGPIGRLRGHLDHFSYRTVSEFLVKLDEYSTLWAQQAFAEGRRARRYHALALLTGFIGRYLFRAGLLDGAPGARWALFAGLHSYMKYAKLGEVQRAAARRRG
jgi:glycosyltransferase involved in cell wall biosynthesis